MKSSVALVFILLTAAQVVHSAGASDRGDGASSTVTSAWRVEDITGRGGVEEPSDMLALSLGGMVLTLEAQRSGVVMLALGPTGSLLTRHVISLLGSPNLIALDNLNRIYVLQRVPPTDGSASTALGRWVSILDSNGKKLREFSLGAVLEHEELSRTAVGLAIAPCGTMYLGTRSGIEVFDPNGKPQRPLLSGRMVRGLAADSSGGLYVVHQDQNGQQSRLSKIDPTSGRSSWDVVLQNAPLELQLLETKGLLLVLDAVALTRFSLGGVRLEAVTSPVSTATLEGRGIVTSFLSLPDGNVFLAVHRANGANVLLRCTPVAPDIGTQHVLTISHAFTPDRLLTLAIATFEKQNPGWSVHVLHPINDAAMAGTDFFGILSSIMVDLMAGRGADLIQFLFLPDPQQLIRKGMLLPLDPILSSDAEFDIRAFRKSVVDAMRTGGNLYFFPLSFSQSVLYAGAQKLGLIDDRAWTWPDFFDACIAAMDAVNGHVPTRFAFPKIDANSFFSMYVLPALAEAYIDRSASESHFNDLSFIRILEGTKEFCRLNGQGNPYGDGDFFKGIQKGDIFLLFASLNGPRDLAMYAEVFPNGVRVLSVPHVGASGDAFVTMSAYGIRTGSKNVQKAWEFLNVTLSENIQEDASSIVAPVLLKAFQKGVEYDRVTAAGSLMGGGGLGPVRLKAITNQQIASVEDMFGRISRVQPLLSDSALRQIIMKEVTPFFSGQTTAGAAASAIDEKLAVWLRE